MSAESSPRRGLLGGSFNPPHTGHLIVAHVVREALGLDDVVLVPNARHPFKGDSETPARDRLAMVELAVAGDEHLTVDRIEIDRGGASYTVDTLEALRAREPETRWFLIIGWDNLDELGAWHEAARLPEMAHLVVMTRSGSGRGSREPELPFPGTCTMVEVPALEISSSAVRRRVAEGHSVRYWVPPGVEAYIAEHGLYDTSGA